MKSLRMIFVLSLLLILSPFLSGCSGGSGSGTGSEAVIGVTMRNATTPFFNVSSTRKPMQKPTSR